MLLLDYALEVICCCVCGRAIDSSEAHGLDSFQNKGTWYCGHCAEEIDYENTGRIN